MKLIQPRITIYQFQGRNALEGSSESEFERVTEETYQQICRILRKHSSVSRSPVDSMEQFFMASDNIVVQIRKQSNEHTLQNVSTVASGLDVFMDYIRLQRGVCKPEYINMLTEEYNAKTYHNQQIMKNLSPLKGLIPEGYYDW